MPAPAIPNASPEILIKENNGCLKRFRKAVLK
jgi:hypothetical protein